MTTLIADNFCIPKLECVNYFRVQWVIANETILHAFLNLNHWFCSLSLECATVEFSMTFLIVKPCKLPYGWKFSLVQIFVKQAKIRVSEIFLVLIFAVGETGIHGLANTMAKSWAIFSTLFYSGARKVASYQATVMIASTLGLAPLSGSCVCAYVAFRFPG